MGSGQSFGKENKTNGKTSKLKGADEREKSLQSEEPMPLKKARREMGDVAETIRNSIERKTLAKYRSSLLFESI